MELQGGRGHSEGEQGPGSFKRDHHGTVLREVEQGTAGHFGWGPCERVVDWQLNEPRNENSEQFQWKRETLVVS